MPATSSRLALITGTSSGIGEALAHELLRRGWNVVGAARRPATIESERYTHLVVDLQDLRRTREAIERNLGARVSDPGVGRLALVNNAAHIALLGPVEQMDPGQLLKVYAVNVAAPTWLMGWFLRRGRKGVPLRIVNVSTGAAVRPFPGLGAYATSKAALRMAGMVLATELEAADPAPGRRRNATILSYEPGVVDTEMQASARSASSQVLPGVETFKQFAAEGRLVPASEPAREIADHLDSDGHALFSETRYGPPPATQ